MASSLDRLQAWNLAQCNNIADPRWADVPDIGLPAGEAVDDIYTKQCEWSEP